MTCDYKLPRRQGWRTFHCECGLMFCETTRDFLSPSLTTCPKCNSDTFPIDSWKDETVKVDECSNLIKYEIVSGKYETD